VVAVSSRVWTQGLMLASQAFYHLSHFASPVLCFIFEIGSQELFSLTGFEPWFSWSLPLKWLGLQEWATGTRLLTCFAMSEGPQWGYIFNSAPLTLRKDYYLSMEVHLKCFLERKVWDVSGSVQSAPTPPHLTLLNPLDFFTLWISNSAPMDIT
jgi:hypothetical protein